MLSILLKGIAKNLLAFVLLLSPVILFSALWSGIPPHGHHAPLDMLLALLHPGIPNIGMILAAGLFYYSGIQVVFYLPSGYSEALVKKRDGVDYMVKPHFMFVDKNNYQHFLGVRLLYVALILLLISNFWSLVWVVYAIDSSVNIPIIGPWISALSNPEKVFQVMTNSPETAGGIIPYFLAVVTWMVLIPWIKAYAYIKGWWKPKKWIRVPHHLGYEKMLEDYDRTMDTWRNDFAFRHLPMNKYYHIYRDD